MSRDDTQVHSEPRRFYDGGVLAIGDRIGLPPDPAAEARIVLERHAKDGPERFSMERRIAYRDRHFGEILVPSHPDFRTDLTSVPALFTWLVPKTGAHLPAALIHDALVESDGTQSYQSTRGFRIDRVEADRVFRDAMADTGTGVIRRWIVWSAVTAATIFVPGGLTLDPVRRWAHRVGAAISIATILYLGYSATSDLFDQRWWLACSIPWMGDHALWVEIAGGLSAAIVLPLALSLLWGQFWRAGAIGGVMLAVLLHVTVGLLAISLTYLALERLARWSATAAWLVAGVAVATASVVFLMMLV